MPTLTGVVRTPRSIDEVFGFVGDFANVARWDPGVSESAKVTEGPIRVGTEFQVQVDFNGRALPMTYTVTVWDPPRRVVLVGEGSTVHAVDDITFEATAEGTTVTYRADLKLKGLAALFGPFLSKRFQQLGNDAMEGMERALETGSASAPG